MNVLVYAVELFYTKRAPEGAQYSFAFNINVCVYLIILNITNCFNNFIFC